jgi:hypothetical protein
MWCHLLCCVRRALRFEDKPDYSFLRRMFRDLFAKEGEAAPVAPLFVDVDNETYGAYEVEKGLERVVLPEVSIVCMQLLLNLTQGVCYVCVCVCVCPGWNWDYVFDWTILKYQRSNGVDRPIIASANAAALPATAAAAGIPAAVAQQQQQQQQQSAAVGAGADVGGSKVAAARPDGFAQKQYRRM